MPDEVKIRCPQVGTRIAVNRNNRGGHFFVHGIGTGSLNGVRGWIDNVPARQFESDTILFVTRNNVHRWIVRFKWLPALPHGNHKLRIRGSHDRVRRPDPASDTGTPHDLDIDLSMIGAAAAPDFGHPPIQNGGYTLTDDEKEFFVAWGTEDNPLIEARVSAINADYIYDDVDIHYWCAHFSDLGTRSPGDQQEFRVVDSLDQAGQRIVNVPQ